MTSLTREGDVFVLDIGDDEPDSDHRFSPERIAAINAALDEVEATEGPAAIVTMANGKFYSNGLQPERFVGAPEDVIAYLNSVETLLARVLVMPVPSVAAIQGHAFGGALMLALAQDERYMREDRGFLCLPEVQINFPFTDGMTAFVQSRLSQPTKHIAMCTGKRYGGADALAAGMVDGVTTLEELVPTAIARAAELAPLRGPALGTIKQGLYAGVVNRLAKLGVNP